MSLARPASVRLGLPFGHVGRMTRSSGRRGRRTNLRGAHLAHLAASQALAVRHSQEGFNKEDKEFDAFEWLAAMCFHVPNKGEQMVRYDARLWRCGI